VITCLSEFDVSGLEQHLAAHGYRPVQARRVLREFYLHHGHVDLDELRIGRCLRDWFEQNIALRQSSVRLRHDSSDGTVKLLVDLARGGAVETVLMPAHRPDRAAACVSSQIGCAMGCDFCASTREGMERNLTAGEIVEQFFHVSREAAQRGRRIRSLVFMGMGEPMHNLESVIAAIHRIADRSLGNLGYRAITVSTVGIVPGIDRLAQENLGVHLALSLHAPDDETRGKLVPANRRWRVRDIIDAAKRFQHHTGRPVNVEYCLLSGVNDSPEQAELLASLLDGWRAHVNLIPYNTIGAGVSGAVYSRPSAARIERFASILAQRGVVTHTRVTRGDDIAAACGQLRVSDSPVPAGRR
jgi:23S rRNA (adenine2503-C2)-methyltransferase